MPPLPRVPGRDVVRAFQRAGWTIYRVRGSHHLLKGPDGGRISVPVHGNRTLPVGTLDGILDDADTTVEEFIALLRGDKR